MLQMDVRGALGDLFSKQLTPLMPWSVAVFPLLHISCWNIFVISSFVQTWSTGRVLDILNIFFGRRKGSSLTVAHTMFLLVTCTFELFICARTGMMLPLYSRVVLVICTHCSGHCTWGLLLYGNSGLFAASLVFVRLIKWGPEKYSLIWLIVAELRSTFLLSWLLQNWVGKFLLSSSCCNVDTVHLSVGIFVLSVLGACIVWYCASVYLSVVDSNTDITTVFCIFGMLPTQAHCVLGFHIFNHLSRIEVQGESILPESNHSFAANAGTLFIWFPYFQSPVENPRRPRWTQHIVYY